MAYYQPAHPPVQLQMAARAPARKQSKRLEACVYSPGLYRLPNPHAPTPAAILSGAYSADEGIENFPRRAQFCGRPCLSIPFTVGGHPAPYLKDALKDRVLIDGAEDPVMVMADNTWSRTRWVLEWPGYDLAARNLPVAGLTRLALVKEIAKCVAVFLQSGATGPSSLGDNHPWSLRNVHFGDIRLVALNYYGRVWVPILALDAA
ncbi:hypothetical protein B0H16DRAFT_399596 [Mycena metata]|uniref:Uncharacterized protein n=1 Tax=Mycena metata TaxID=1033252 RepID=A0AAD7NKL3_9AGAR|nr:hypothetical protein B0H16DRAFT_399596 [Mycena metata]